MLGYAEKLFIGLLNFCTIRSFYVSLTFNSRGSIKYVSLNNQPCQTRLTLANIDSVMKFFFIHLLLVIISVMEVVTLLMIYDLEFVFQTKWKIWM